MRIEKGWCTKYSKWQKGKYFKNVRNWRSFCKENHFLSLISLNSYTQEMFSKFIWHVVLGRFEAVSSRHFWNFRRRRHIRLMIRTTLVGIQGLVDYHIERAVRRIIGGTLAVSSSSWFDVGNICHDVLT